MKTASKIQSVCHLADVTKELKKTFSGVLRERWVDRTSLTKQVKVFMQKMERDIMKSKPAGYIYPGTLLTKIPGD